jgi:hypothetical protein
MARESVWGLGTPASGNPKTETSRHVAVLNAVIYVVGQSIGNPSFYATEQQGIP